MGMNVPELRHAADNLLPADIAADVKRHLDDEARAEISEHLDSPRAGARHIRTLWFGAVTSSTALTIRRALSR